MYTAKNCRLIKYVQISRSLVHWFTEAKEEKQIEHIEKERNQEKGQRIAAINRERRVRGLPPVGRATHWTPHCETPQYGEALGYDEHPETV